MPRSIRDAALVLAVAAAPSLTAQQPTAFKSALDGEVREIMEAWELPGLALVVVKDGEVLALEGYGTRMAGRDLPVDGNTLVQVASHSKAVTATALAMLVDAGLLSWDDPVRKHIPGFGVDDPYAAERITVRDLVSHRAGLPRAAFGGFRNSRFGLAELLDTLRSRRPAPLRSGQMYSQSSIALAGEVVARVSGLPWERFVRERIFLPLGMSDSYTSHPDLVHRFGEPSPARNAFMPGVKRDGGVLPGRDWRGIGTDRLYAPAGGIVTTASDMARWITFLVRDGEHGGGRLLSADALADTREPLVPLDPLLREFTDPVGPLAAGTLGWNAVAHQGNAIYFAPGGWMSTVVALVPEAGLGVGVFTNAYFSERHGFESLFPVYALAMEVIDLALGLPPTDWSRAYAEALARGSS